MLSSRHIPALQIEPDKNGLISAVYISKPSMIKYKEFKKVSQFYGRKNAKNAVDLHLSQNFLENFLLTNTVKR